MTFDYSRLRGKIKEVFNTQEAFAKAMRFSTQTLSVKLNNKVEFTQEEMLRAATLLHFPAMDIPLFFYTLEVQESEQIV